MLKLLNMALICCPIVLARDITAVFELKISQIDTENNKNPKTFHILKFFCLFV